MDGTEMMTGDTGLETQPEEVHRCQMPRDKPEHTNNWQTNRWLLWTNRGEAETGNYLYNTTGSPKARGCEKEPHTGQYEGLYKSEAVFVNMLKPKVVHNSLRQEKILKQGACQY